MEWNAPTEISGVNSPNTPPLPAPSAGSQEDSAQENLPLIPHMKVLAPDGLDGVVAVEGARNLSGDCARRIGISAKVDALDVYHRPVSTTHMLYRYVSQ